MASVTGLIGYCGIATGSRQNPGTHRPTSRCRPRREYAKLITGLVEAPLCYRESDTATTTSIYRMRKIHMVIAVSVARGTRSVEPGRRDVANLLCDERYVVQRLALHGQAVPVAFLG
jgi:hypothetical protein